MSSGEDYLIRRYGELNPNDWISNVYDDGGPLPPGQMPINLAPRPLEGELISETWLPVVGYEDLYEVSDLGRVRSLDREVPGRNQHGPFVQKLRGKALKLRAGTSGHLQVKLYRDGKVSMRGVHRLVLEAFRGSCPDGYQACHYDDDPSNNRLDNLRWGTKSENNLDRVRNGRHHEANKTHCPQGHEYTPENVYLNGGRRSCNTCRRERVRAYRARRRAA